MMPSRRLRVAVVSCNPSLKYQYHPEERECEIRKQHTVSLLPLLSIVRNRHLLPLTYYKYNQEEDGDDPIKQQVLKNKYNILYIRE